MQQAAWLLDAPALHVRIPQCCIAADLLGVFAAGVAEVRIALCCSQAPRTLRARARLANDRGDLDQRSAEHAGPCIKEGLVVLAVYNTHRDAAEDLAQVLCIAFACV